MRSIRLSLLKWLLLPLLLLNLVGAAGTYWLAWRPTQIAFDQSLADVAWALLRRAGPAQTSVQVGELTLDTAARRAMVRGRPIELSVREWGIL